MARRSPYILLLSSVLLLWSSTAMAQDSMEPTGFTAGRVRMHPGVFVGGAWDSNLFYDDGSVNSEDPSDVWALRAGLSFRAVTDQPKDVDWWASARAAWEQYFSEFERATDQSGIETTIATGVHLWPERTFKLSPNVSYTRTNGPADDFAQRNYNQHSVQAGVDAVIQPSMGKVFSQTLGYNYQVQLYDELDDINRHHNQIHSVTRWNFLFQTALTLLLEQGFVRYFEGVRTPPGGIDPGFTLENVNSNPFRAQLGVKGLLFNRVDFTLLAGYGWTGYESGANSHLFLAAVELGYKWTDNDKISAGYIRNFNDSTFGNFYTFHRGYLRFSTRFIDRISAAITGRITYAEFTQVEGFAQARDDLIYDADLALAYTFIPGFKATLTYLLRGNETEFGTVINGRATSAAYIKHIVELTLSYEY